MTGVLVLPPSHITTKLTGAETEFVPYPGKAHGYDFADTDPAAADAIDRITRFFQAKLAA